MSMDSTSRSSQEHCSPLRMAASSVDKCCLAFVDPRVDLRRVLAVLTALANAALAQVGFGASIGGS